MAGIQVTDNRPWDHHARTSTERLHRTKTNQHFDGRCQRAADAANGKDHQTRINRWFTPEHIAEGAVEQLAHTDNHEEHRQTHLHRRRRGLEASAQGGQCRQIDVDGKGADGGDQAQQQGQTGDTLRHLADPGRATDAQLKGTAQIRKLRLH